MIFLMLAAVLFFSRCETPAGPFEQSLNGTWDISWTAGDERLNGKISFEDDRARVRAFGESGSGFIDHYEEADFAVLLSGRKLILTNKQTGIRLEYLVISSETEEWTLSYLNEVNVRLQRNSN